MARPDAADRWLAANDPARRRRARRELIETRWDGRLIRVWMPRRTYRPELVARLSASEAEALVRNLGRRLAERDADGAG